MIILNQNIFIFLDHQYLQTFADYQNILSVYCSDFLQFLYVIMNFWCLFFPISLHQNEENIEEEEEINNLLIESQEVSKKYWT